MSMFRTKKRSAHGISRPWGFTQSAKTMSGAGEDAPAPAYVDSVITALDKESPGAINEPLVLDFAAMHDGYSSKEQQPPLTPPASDQKPSLEREDSWLSDEESAPAPPAFTSRDIHVPLRTSSSTPAANRQRMSMQRRLSFDTSTLNMPQTPESSRARSASGAPMAHTPTGAPRTLSRARNTEPTTLRSSADSVISLESTGASFMTQDLAPLQQKGGLPEDERLSPLLEDDPKSFDLLAPGHSVQKQFSLEDRSEQLFSKEHLQAIFKDTPSLLRFTSYLSAARPQSVPTLIYYLDALKALRAINYANAVAEALEPIKGLDFTSTSARPTVNAVLEEQASRAFHVLTRDDLPAFITHVFTQVVSVSIAKKVTGQLSPLLREASEGLAEVFCLTDPSRTDNPIIFASEEFHRTTQYGVNHAMGRNCRFLQGPKTNRSSVARFGAMVKAGQEHSEVFLNYRRDGSPFMNLLMMAPLLDSRGNLRYFIGAQIDVSGLVKDCTDLDAFRRMLDQREGVDESEPPKDEFQELSEMFNHSELDTIKRFGGSMHREQVDENQRNGGDGHRKPTLLIQDQSTLDVDKAETPAAKADGRLTGPYKHYLLIRPSPSLRILFTSPSLRVPGILQSHFLDRIGGSTRVRHSLATALADGSRGVTAKIRWLSHAVPNLDGSTASDEGRPRWIHCTPLLGQNGAVGVWMVVLVDEDKHAAPMRRFRQAPPVPIDVRGGSSSSSGGNDAVRSQQSLRTDGFEDSDVDVLSVRTASVLSGSVHPSGAARHVAVDALRQPASPREARNYEQRAVRSAGSSVRGYGNGREGSLESFRIC